MAHKIVGKKKIMPDKKLFTRLMAALLFCSVLYLTPDTYGQQFVNDIIGKIHYRSIGPTRQGGRIVDFAVPLQQDHTFYTAAANGGLWKTVNNGTTFFSIFDHQNVFAIGDIAVDQNNPNTVWVGTGEANFSTTDPYATYWGDGIYKSTDGGETWRNMGLNDTHQIGRIIVHPQNSDIVYVAALGHLYTENEERGVFKTTNGGRTWEKSLGVVQDGRHISVVDLVMDPSNPDILYASSYDRIAKPWMFYEGGPGSGIYKTTNGGESWTQLTNGLPSERVGRIGLAISPQNPGVLYAYVMEDRDSDGQYENRIYRTVNGGARWEQRSPEPISGKSYFGQIRIDPEDDNHVYSLTFGVLQSFDGGRTWSLAFENGGDHHALWIDPRDNKHILSGFDYGLSITYDGGKNWYHPDEIPLAQLYEIGVDMAYPYNVYGGTQDFGTFKGPSTKKGRFPIRFEDWEHMLGGDGYYSKVDPVTNRWLYAESQNGSLSKVDMETGVRKNITYRGNPDIRMNFSAPILISPHNSNVIYHGANMVLRSSFRGENWEEISPDLTTNNPELRDIGPLAYSTITTLDESPVRQGVIWAGTDDGNVQLTTDDGETWTKLNDRITGNPGYWVSRVAASHHDAGTAYVTYTGRRQDDFRPFVYKTIDFGQTWESIANNLPNDEPVNVLREDHKNPNLLFIGTEKTVHVSLDGGESWTRMQNNLPTTGVKDLVIHPRENDLVVGSHGRSLFIADISVLQELTPAVTSKNVHLFDIGPKVQWVMTSQKAVSAQNYTGENEPHGAVINYYLKESARNNVTVLIYDGSRLIQEISGSGSAGLNSVEWYMTKRKRKRTREEISQYDRRVANARENYFFDYYDTVDFYGDSDEEVDKYGRSLRTRVARESDARGREYVLARVRPGTYTVKLSVDGGEYTGQAVILKDHWYDK
jgi:photosystem II stability/assembly factor-like uncharacterized protein